MQVPATPIPADLLPGKVQKVRADDDSAVCELFAGRRRFILTQIPHP